MHGTTVPTKVIKHMWHSQVLALVCCTCTLIVCTTYSMYNTTQYLPPCTTHSKQYNTVPTSMYYIQFIQYNTVPIYLHVLHTVHAQ